MNIFKICTLALELLYSCRDCKMLSVIQPTRRGFSRRPNVLCEFCRKLVWSVTLVVYVGLCVCVSIYASCFSDYLYALIAVGVLFLLAIIVIIALTAHIIRLKRRQQKPGKHSTLNSDSNGGGGYNVLGYFCVWERACVLVCAPMADRVMALFHYSYGLQIWLACSHGHSGHHTLPNFRKGVVARVTWSLKINLAEY